MSITIEHVSFLTNRTFRFAERVQKLAVSGINCGGDVLSIKWSISIITDFTFFAFLAEAVVDLVCRAQRLAFPIFQRIAVSTTPTMTGHCDFSTVVWFVLFVTFSIHLQLIVLRWIRVLSTLYAISEIKVIDITV